MRKKEWIFYGVIFFLLMAAMVGFITHEINTITTPPKRTAEPTPQWIIDAQKNHQKAQGEINMEAEEIISECDHDATKIVGRVIAKLEKGNFPTDAEERALEVALPYLGTDRASLEVIQKTIDLYVKIKENLEEFEKNSNVPADSPEIVIIGYTVDIIHTYFRLHPAFLTKEGIKYFIYEPGAKWREEIIKSSFPIR